MFRPHQRQDPLWHSPKSSFERRPWSMRQTIATNWYCRQISNPRIRFPFWTSVPKPLACNDYGFSGSTIKTSSSRDTGSPCALQRYILSLQECPLSIIVTCTVPHVRATNHRRDPHIRGCWCNLSLQRYLLPGVVLQSSWCKGKGDVGIGEIKGTKKVRDDPSPTLVISAISYHLPISFSYMVFHPAQS